MKNRDSQNPLNLKMTLRSYLISANVILLLSLFGTPRLQAQSAAYDVAKAEYAGDGKSLSYAARGVIGEFTFNNDGTKLFMLGQGTGLSRRVYEYTVGTPFDVSTASYLGDGELFFAGNETSNQQSLEFNADGTRMYINDSNGTNSEIFEYTLNTAFDVSTATYNGDGEKLQLTAVSVFVRRIRFNNDGTKLFAVYGNEIHEYALSTAYDVSTATYSGDGEKLAVTQPSLAIPGFPNDSVGAFVFSNDGTKLIVLGTTENRLYTYNLSTAFDISTATDAGNLKEFGLNRIGRNLRFSPNGLTFIIDNSSAGKLEVFKIPNPVTMVSATKDSDTQITITFNQNVKSLGGNPTDFTVKDTYSGNFATPNTFAVTAQQDGTLGDNKVVLTVANLSTATGDLVITYTNNNGEILSSPDNVAMPTDGTGITMDIDQTAPTMVSASISLGTTILLTMSEKVKAANTNPADFTVADGLANTFAVTAIGSIDDELLQLSVPSLGSAAGNITVIYTNNNSEVKDFGGNNLATNGTGVTILDNTAPTISSAAKNSDTQITLTFSEAVQTNGTNPTDFTVEDSQATNFVVTAQADGIAQDNKVVLTVANMSTAVGDLFVKYQNNNNEIKDFANNSLATNNVGVRLNLTGPTFTSGTTASFNENATGTVYTAVATDIDGVSYSLGISKDETKFNINNSNGQLTFLSSPDFESPTDLGANNTYTIDVIASDGAFATTLEVVITVLDVDDVSPTVTLVTTSTGPTNQNFTVDITLSEPVTTFVPDDISVAFGRVASLTGSGTSFQAIISPTADGLLTVVVLAGAIQDAAGNNNTASNTISITSDITRPTVSITSAAAGYTIGAFNITITFNESVTGLELSEIIAANATISNLSGTGSTYTATATPIADGLVTINLAENVALDAAGNLSTVATQFSIINDETKPTVDILSNDVSGSTNLNSFRIIINFNEAISGLTVGDLVLTNATASAFGGNLHQWEAIITPIADGEVTINVGAGAAQDVAGNNNIAATTFRVIVDRTGPTLTITGDRVGITNAPFTATFAFNETVIGFNADDIVLNKASLSNFSGSGAVYTATITPVSEGTITIDVAANQSTDAAGNLSSAAAQFSITYDATAPTTSITSASSNLTSGAFNVTITFSETVTDFIVGDISVTNGSAGNFAGSGTTYTATITPAADGLVVVDVNADKASDAAANGNRAASQFRITNDQTAPTVTLVASKTGLTNSDITLTITFSESVTGFVIGDLDLTNATASNFSGSGTGYTVLIKPITDGTVTVALSAGKANDAAGNGNAAATSFTITADLTAPVAPLVTAITEDRGASSTDQITTDQTLIFSGAAEASSTVEVFIGASSIGTTTANSSGSWTFDHTATTLSEGVYEVTAQATDAAENTGTLSSIMVVKVDLHAEVPFIDSISDDTGNSQADGFTTDQTLMIYGLVEAGSTVTLFLDGIAIGTTSADTNGNWTFDHTGTVLSTGEYLLTASIVDLAGNQSSLSGPFNINIDATGPKIVFNDLSGVNHPVNARNAAYGVGFSEKVAGFSIDLFTLSGPAAVNASITSFGTELGDSENLSFTLFIEGIDTSKGETFTITLTNPGGITDLSGNPMVEGFTQELRTNATPIDISLDPIFIDENNEVGVKIGTLRTVDLDGDDTHTFSIVEGDGDEDNANFSIVGNELFAAVSFDYEPKDVNVFRVRVDDGDGGVFEKVMALFVQNVPEAKMSDLGNDVINIPETPLNVERQFIVNIFNEGDANLIITDIQTPEGFEVIALPEAITSLGEADVIFIFRPTEAKEYFGEVIFIYSEGTESIQVIGTGAVVTGEEKEFVENGIVVYPNPSNGSVNVDLSTFKGESVQIELKNITGTTLIQKTIKATELTLNLENLASGLYLLILRERGHQVIRKIEIRR